MPGKRTNTQKNGRGNDLWHERKRQGRPKQQWVPSTLFDERIDLLPMDVIATFTDAEVLAIVPAHWEKIYE